MPILVAGVGAHQPARRLSQGRSPAGVERSESLDAGEHRITIATAGQIANLKPQGPCLISRVLAGTMSLWSSWSASP